MRKKTIFSVLQRMCVIALFLLILVNNTQAQKSGRILGIVADSLSGSILPGANVIIKNATIGSATDLNGEYMIVDIAPGKYTVKATYMGYRGKEIQIELTSGETLVLNFDLRSDVMEGDVIEVSAQREGQLAAINQMVQSDQLINVVSAERMREVPDGNAAESIGRLPGISMKRSSGEGQGVIIRGLSPKYNTVKLNGVDFAASGSADRGIDLSFITTEALGGIEVFKSLTADMDADNIGGTVNMKMSKAKSEPSYEARLYGAYNQLENDWAQFRGFFLASGRVLGDKIGIQASLNTERRNRGRDRMTATFYQKDLPITPENPNPGVFYEIRSASIDDRQETRSRYGGSLTLDGGTLDHQFILSNLLSYTDQHILSRQHIYTDGGGVVKPMEIEKNSYSIINTLEGKHQLGSFQMDWNFGHSFAKGQTPFMHWMEFREGNVGIPDITLNPEDFLSQMEIDSAASFYWSFFNAGSSEERRLSGALNLKYPFNLSPKISGFIKMGGKFTHIDHKNDERNAWGIATWLGTDVRIEDWIDPNYDPGPVLNGRTELGLILNPAKNRPFYDEVSSKKSFYAGDDPFYGGNNDYEASEKISAGYIMGQFKYAGYVIFTPGIRYESEDNTYSGYYRLINGAAPDYFGTYDPQTTDRKRDYWFPMAQLKIQPLSFMDIRLSYTETISRPNFLWLIPSESRKSLDRNVGLGQPTLKPALSKNYDVSISLYDGKYGFFSIGYFQKDIKDFSYPLTPHPIDSADAVSYGIPPTVDYINYDVSTFVNTTQNSTVKGFEFDIQPNLSMLPGFLSGFVIHANLALIQSDSWLTHKEVTGFDPVTWLPVYSIGFRKGPLPNQAEYVTNLSLGYDIGGFSARVSMYLQGESLNNVGTIESEDAYVNAFKRIDFTMKMNVTKHLTFYLNGVNLGNEPDVQRQANTTKYRLVEYYGAMYDFGIGYRF